MCFVIFSRDDQMDTIETMREEFELLQTELIRIKNENIELNQNTRLTRLYRDEIDTLNDKIIKMERHQQELERYKERNHEYDSLKNRITELENESKNYLFSINYIYIHKNFLFFFRSSSYSSTYSFRKTN